MANAKKTAADSDGETKQTEAPVADDKQEKKDKKESKPRKERNTGKKVVAGANALRSRIATIVWLIAVVCALFLAVGALLVALKANPDNAIVQFIKDGAHALDLGVFSPSNGLFTPSKDPDLIKGALINWGIAAIAYLVIGKVVERIIRP